MPFVQNKAKIKILNYFPLILLLFISLNGNSIIDFNFLSINVHYIIVYFWVLRDPKLLGYGFIFLSGIISDVIFGTPMGITALSLLVVASVAAYIRVVTVRISLVNDWISFLPALLLANFFYFISMYFSDLPINYIYLIKNSFFTFIFYPILWIIFSLFFNFIKR